MQKLLIQASHDPGLGMVVVNTHGQNQGRVCDGAQQSLPQLVVFQFGHYVTSGPTNLYNVIFVSVNVLLST